MVNRVSVQPELLLWARERSGSDAVDLQLRFPQLVLWETGSLQPTLRQLEKFAKAVHVPIGYFFLDTPPVEFLPITDFRVVADSRGKRPSPNLLDTIYICQQRQEWFRDYARIHGQSPLEFVNSATLTTPVETVASAMRKTLGVSTADRRTEPNWTSALITLKLAVEEAGVLLMASSVVENNTARKLRVEEFRGFALTDSYAPLIFINASDSKSAQMFTIIHELAHIWLGESGVSDSNIATVSEVAIERWCNAVAAEFLVPRAMLLEEYRSGTAIDSELQRLARVFKVSTLVVLRSLFDAGLLNQPQFKDAYIEETARLRVVDAGGSGGDFYRTLRSRVGGRFARAVCSSALEGQTLFRDAYRMLGIRKSSTFQTTARELGVLL